MCCACVRVVMLISMLFFRAFHGFCDSAVLLLWMVIFMFLSCWHLVQSWFGLQVGE